jgi:hypothetical protein
MVSKLWIGLLGLDLGVILLHFIMQAKFLHKYCPVLGFEENPKKT